MSEPTTRFYVCAAWTPAIARSEEIARRWMEAYEPEVMEWLETSLSGPFTLECEVDFTDYQTAMGAYNIYVTFTKDADALLYKLRWR